MRLDFTPVLLAAVLAFVGASMFQFLNSIAAGERGLLLFETFCKIHSGVL
jgi:hypothetical protein